MTRKKEAPAVVWVAVCPRCGDVAAAATKSFAPATCNSCPWCTAKRVKVVPQPYAAHEAFALLLELARDRAQYACDGMPWGEKGPKNKDARHRWAVRLVRQTCITRKSKKKCLPCRAALLVQKLNEAEGRS